MKLKSIGLRIGIAMAAVHLCLAILAYIAMITSRSSTAGLIFTWFGFFDAPVLFLPHSIFATFGSIAPLIQFEVLGSTLWFLIPWLIVSAYCRLFPKGPRFAGVVILVIAISRLSSELRSWNIL